MTKEYQVRIDGNASSHPDLPDGSYSGLITLTKTEILVYTRKVTDFPPPTNHAITIPYNQIESTKVTDGWIAIEFRDAEFDMISTIFIKVPKSPGAYVRGVHPTAALNKTIWKKRAVYLRELGDATRPRP